MPWHPWLRDQLVDALRSVSPDAPTLCEGWQARHLAAHIVLREHAPWRLVGRGLELRADEARDDAGYRQLIDTIARPPRAWSPHSWAGDSMNLAEFYVHAQDVRRGGGTQAPPPMDLPPDLVDELRKPLSMFAKMRLRRSHDGVVLVDDAGRRRTVRDGDPTVEIHGPVPELLLEAFGRGAVARTEFVGTPDAVTRVRKVLSGGDE